MKRRRNLQAGVRVGVSLPATALLVSVGGCASIINGTHQDVSLAVQPPQSSVMVYRLDGERVAGPGISPGTLDVHRPEGGQSYLIVATHDGYCPSYLVTKMGVSTTATQGNILLGGVVGLAVDSANGAGFAIDPATISDTLVDASQCQ